MMQRLARLITATIKKALLDMIKQMTTAVEKKGSVLGVSLPALLGPALPRGL